jgi:hypothetical protein
MPPLAVPELSAALGELAAKSGESASKLISRIGSLAPDEARAFVTDAYPKLIDPFLSASGELTAAWYAEQPAAPIAKGAAAFIPTPAPLPPADQLAISARWALTQNDALTALRGSAVRSTMNASRNTVVTNAALEGVKWVRHAQPNACGFCKMLATRTDGYGGRGVKLNQKTGKFELRVVGRSGSGRTRGTRNNGQKYHDHCRCTAIPLRDGIYEPPDYVQQWTDEYNAAFTPGMKLTDIARAMDAGRVRPDRVAAKLAKGLPDVVAEVAQLRDIAAPAVNLDAPAKPKKAPMRPLDQVEADFYAAVDAGDDALITKFADEMEAVEAAEKKAEARRARDAARREAIDRAKWDEVSRLIDQGVNPLEAESDVFKISMDKLRRREFIKDARADGIWGAGFDELVTKKTKLMIEEQFRAAEDATNGRMLKRKYAATIDERQLWTAPEVKARAWMSEEMAAWFDQHGRITRAALRQSILDGNPIWRSALGEDFLQ